jgi:phosphoribosylamine---glycine ligase
LASKRFLFVSLEGLITDIAKIIKEEGHEVKFYTKNPEERGIGEGFYEKVEDWESFVDWADVIVFDDVLGQGDYAKALRDKGKKVIGGTPYTDKLEDNREFGQSELKKMGINVISSKDFFSFDDAISYVEKNRGRYVIKPTGSIGSIKRLLFVGEDPLGIDVLQVLKDYKAAWKGNPGAIQLQKRIMGIEVAVGAFFNGNKFVYPINVNFEHKKLFPGNLGPSTGEMGTSMFWSNPNKIFNCTLKKFEKKLAEEKYVGYVDINCIVNGHGIYPLEWTTRFGYPTISIQEEGMVTPMGEFFYRLASGEDFSFKVKKGFQVGVRIVVPPFPYDDPETFEVKSKDSVITFKTNDLEGIHPEDVKKVNGEWLVTGTSGVVMIVCGSGVTMKQAIAQAYSRIKNIIIPHMYYRDDIGERWFEDSDKLHAWGYLREV